jgi:hypothetical protein
LKKILMVGTAPDPASNDALEIRFDEQAGTYNTSSESICAQPC